MVLRGLPSERIECSHEGRVLSTTSLSTGKGLQALAVEERREQANRETLAHGREEVRLGSPGRRPLCSKALAWEPGELSSGQWFAS